VIAGPLRYGDLASGEERAPTRLPDPRSPLRASVGVYFRMSPTAEVPTPPVLPLYLDVQASFLDPSGRHDVPVYTAAPIFMGPDGSPRETL
jgi:hypothetical protein